MSAQFTTPGQAFDHLLRPIKGYHPDWPMDVRGQLDAAVDLTVVVPHSGRVVFEAGLVSPPRVFSRGPKIPTFQMGCAGIGKGPPIWLYAGVYEPDISNQGTPSTVPSVGQSGYPPNWVSALPGRDPKASQQVWGLWGHAALEIETTEFDTAQTYAQGQFLRAVTLNNNANSGSVTNQNASGGAAFATTSTTFTLYSTGTADTVVGIVGHGSYKNADDRQVLSVLTWFLPGTR